jgi:acetyl-CoA C-acetyltransferase
MGREKNMDRITQICPPLKRGVIILGAAQTKFSISKIPLKSIRDLAAEAVRDAMEQAKCSYDDIDMVIVSNAVGFVVDGQGHAAPLILNHIGLNPLPSIRLETACASGAVALRMGAMAIEAGWANNVLVIGAEVMSGMDRATTQKVISGGGDALVEAPVGATFPALYACYGMALIDAFSPNSLPSKQAKIAYGMDSLCYIALKNHANASHNPKAQLNQRIEDLARSKGIENVWDFLHDPKKNPPIAWPLRLFDCSPTSDGGGAIILSGADMAPSFSGYKHAIQLKACAQATGHMPMALSPTFTSLPAAHEAALAAYKAVGIDPMHPTNRIKVAEVHDCFTSAEILALGDLNFFQGQNALDAARNGQTSITGSIPINTSGGLKAKGHPIGVTGLSQVVTIRNQLIHQIDPAVQVKNIDLALTHNVGGSGGTACVNIYSLPEVK